VQIELGGKKLSHAVDRFDHFGLFLEFFLDLLPAADVARDFRSADNRAVRRFDRRNRKRYVEQHSVLVLSDRLVMFDALAVSDFFEDDGFFVLTVGRDQNRDRFADYFISRITEYPLRAFVPAGHDAVESLTDDRVFSRFDDRCKPRRFQRKILICCKFNFFPLILHFVLALRKLRFETVKTITLHDTIRRDFDKSTYFNNENLSFTGGLPFPFGQRYNKRKSNVRIIKKTK